LQFPARVDPAMFPENLQEASWFANPALLDFILFNFAQNSMARSQNFQFVMSSVSLQIE